MVVVVVVVSMRMLDGFSSSVGSWNEEILVEVVAVAVKRVRFTTDVRWMD